MLQRRPDLAILIVSIAVLAVLGGLTFANYRYAAQNPGGNDFIPRWLGTRLFVNEGQSPYSAETSHAIQQFIYGGRLARPGEDRQLFVYPHYSMLVFAPFALISDFNLARAVWMTALEVSLIGIAFLSLVIAGWKPRPAMLAGYLVFALLWYHALRPLINGNPSLLVALFIALAIVLIRGERDALAGVILTLTTIKPHMVVLFLPFVLYWAYSRRRFRLVFSMLGTTLLLVAASTSIQPDWIIANLRQILAYPEYTVPGSPGAIFEVWWPGLGSQMGWALTIFLSLILLREWLAAWGKDFRWFMWTAMLTLVITNLVGIRTGTENYIAFFPGLMLAFAIWAGRWGRAGQVLIVVTLVLLGLGLWWLFLTTLEYGAQPIQGPVMYFPFPIFTLLVLYWVRWWALRAPKLPIQQMKAMEKTRT